MHHAYYTIGIDEPFLHTLAKGLLKRFGSSPLALAHCTIFLPTRRSVRALATILLNESGSPSLLLPRIQAVGDVEEDALEINLPTEAEVLPAIAKPRRILLLANELKRWFSAERQRTLTYPEACQWAASLCSVLDETQRYHAPLETLSQLLPPDLPEHRQELLDFLSVIATRWPAILEKEKALDPEQHREALMQAELATWHASPPQHPVIIAGSTGSVPSTTALMQAIATLPQGYVILPGLDTKHTDAVPPHHPQYPLHQLAHKLGVVTSDFKPWGHSSNTAKQDFAHRLFASSIATAQTSLESFSLLEADNETHEATMIALLMRDTLAAPEKTAMLVTPDRALAARVTALLTRWEIAVNDSAGQPFAQTPAGSLLLHTLRSTLQGHAAETLLRVLKHPLCALGFSALECREEARSYEINVLRNRRQNQNPDFTQRLKKAFAPLENALASNTPKMEACLTAHWQSFLALMATETETGEEVLAKRPEGAALLNAYENLLQGAPSITLDSASAYEAVLMQLLGLFSYRPVYGLHPRLSILSPMEARLIDADRVIISSLNDGEWPRHTKADWLGDRLRGLLNLPGREDAESHAAQDFTRLLSGRELFLIRARYQEGSPRNPHAWVLRLALLLSQDISRTTYNAGHWAEWAHQLLSPSHMVAPLEEPTPTPPLEARPTRLSASDIADLMQQPYRYYAKRILELKPLEPLELELEAHLIGNAIHKALERYTKDYPHSEPLPSLQRMLEEEMQHLLPASSPQWKMWQPRLAEIARNFLTYDESERRDYPMVLAEVRGEAAVGLFTIHAKADRIGIAPNGSARISDYKTGAIPVSSDIVSGAKPQLPIENLILNCGGFDLPEETPSITSQAKPVHWKLSATSGKSEYTAIPETNPAYTRQQLLHLLECFHMEKQPYICIPLKSLPNYDAYLHLARIDEIHSAA